jgi:hypothetical protein
MLPHRPGFLFYADAGSACAAAPLKLIELLVD